MSVYQKKLVTFGVCETRRLKTLVCPILQMSVMKNVALSNSVEHFIIFKSNLKVDAPQSTSEYLLKTARILH